MKRVLVFALLTLFASVAGIAQDTGPANPAEQTEQQAQEADKPGSCCAEAAEDTGETGTEADHSQHPAEGTENEHIHKDMTKEQKKQIGVDEKLDRFIPMDLTFRMEDGSEAKLGEIITVPTVIIPVYFSCPNVCHMHQSAVANVLPRVKMKPGTEYQVLSISFDETDNPEKATQEKNNYMAAMDHKYPEAAWNFLTSDLETVETMMDAIGYRYQREGRDFIHPVVLVTVTPDGKISRYIYGNTFLPFDLTLALTEASAGRSGLSVKRIVSYCFSYDPEGKQYVFNITKVAGTVILIFAVFIFLMLTFGGRKKKRKS